MRHTALSAVVLLASSAWCGAAQATREIAVHGVAALQVTRGRLSPVSDESPAVASSEDAGTLPSTDLMIIVPSHGRLDADRRMAIRESWGQYLNASVNCTPCQNRSAKILFVVGTEGDPKEMEAEKSRFGDMGTLVDFGQFRYDSGRAEKTQRSIRYALEHFKFRLLLKVDMDSWVFVDRLIEFLEEHHLFEYNASMPGIYAGNFLGRTDSALAGDPSSRDRTDPPHADGAGYLLTPDLCEFISGMGAPSEDMSGAPKWGDEYGWAPVPRLWSLPNEDASVGLWLEPVNHTKVSMPVSDHNIACDGHSRVLEEHILIDRYVQPEQMRRRWRAYLESGDPCAPLRLPVHSKPRHRARMLRKSRG
mmetsp:Transcript_22953/g.48789  ORF Transcript_22953/g.48789 Transcript_22953/m.48789 type:complete len:363 (-) Transcript_22953:62-1150(-)